MEDSEYLFAPEMEGSLLGAKKIVPIIIELLGRPSSVVDFGGGTGAWLRVFRELTGCEVALVDAPAVKSGLLIEEGYFHSADLSRDIPSLGKFDLAICVECAEHLPANRADSLVDALTAASGKVVFSAAIPGQEGKGHINLRPAAYWKQKFEKRGFVCHDVLRARVIREAVVPWWYRQNLFLFMGSDQPFRSEDVAFLPDEFTLVHERVMQRLIGQGFRDHVRLLLPSLLRALKRRLVDVE